MKNRRYSIQLYTRFKERIDKLDIVHISKKDFYDVLLVTLKENIKYFNKLGLGKKYELEKYFAFDSAIYPIEYTELNVRSLIKVFYKQLAEDLTLENLARVVSSLLDEMLYYELRDFSCPRCDLGILIKQEHDSKNLILVCETCLWREYENGQIYEGIKELSPVKTSILKEKGFIED